MIPKIIHYCWLNPGPIPDEMQKYVKGWKDKLSDYRFICWNFECFPKDSVPWVSDAFDQKKYAFAADYIRLFALHQMGGIYMDVDVEIVKPFDDLLSRKRILGYEKKDQIEAGIMGSESGAAWVSECLKYYEGRRFSCKSADDLTPLPLIITKTLHAMNDNMADVFPPDFFTAKSLSNFQIHCTENTYTIHHFKGSWLPWYTQILYKIRNVIGNENYLRMRNFILFFLPHKICKKISGQDIAEEKQTNS